MSTANNLLSIALSICTLASCYSESPTETEKATFVKMVNFIKQNQADSVRTYLIYKEEDSLRHLSTMANGAALLERSNEKDLSKLTIIKDSTMTNNIDPTLWYYSMQIFDSNGADVGDILMSFQENEANKVVSLFVRQEASEIIIDTTGFFSH